MITKWARKKGIVAENILLLIDNLPLEQSEINPLPIEEIKKFQENVDTHFLPFFTVAFFTGMRFGEMAALKWKNVDFRRNTIHVKETRVVGEETPPKTKKSKRYIKMLPPVRQALEKQQKLSGKDQYVFRDKNGRLLTPDHVRRMIWIPALKKAELEYRPLIQTRHTFASIMIDSGEDLGWIQRMLVHGTLQMIYQHYYSWIESETRIDGSAFLKNTYHKVFAEPEPATS